MKIILTPLLSLLAITATAVTAALSEQEEINTLYSRKIDFVIQDALQTPNQVPAWLSHFSTTNGSFADVDYTSGCPARRANWPAQQHFNRIVTLASLFYTNKNSSSLLPTISKAMDYWFDNNYIPDSCLDQGGLTNNTCPCGTPGFWNTNWFDQMILMPKVISNTCLLLKSNLTSTQWSNCTQVSQRVFDRINSFIYGIGPMTGANMLDAATSVLNLGLLTNNATTIRTALYNYYNQTLITPGTGVDGIKVDGAYLQHGSQIYNGNYGKDFINSVVMVFLQTEDTSFAPPPETQNAFWTLLEGTQWMLMTDSTNLLWEYSVIGRMISFLAADGQASGGATFNLTRVQQSTSNWPNATAFSTIVHDLAKLNTSKTGQGKLKGTRNFYTSDYLVHRSPNYVVTWKGFSTRSSNSECNNDQNPFGFHLSDSAIYTYISGDEYQDVFAAWDWNLVPGTTVDYGATPFGCNITQYYGNTSFVGSVVTSNNKGGMAVMQYLNPMTGNLRWEKTVYFFPGFYAVQIGPIYSQTTAPIVTTLDQSNLKGDVYVNGVLFAGDDTTSFAAKNGTTLWHNKILYTILDNSVTLLVNTASHSVNNWSAIGISQGQATQRIFTATLQHPPAPLLSTGGGTSTAPVSYIAQLNTSAKSSNSSSMVQLIYQDDKILGKVRGAYNPSDHSIALAFWTAGTYSSWGLTVATDQPILTFFTNNKGGGYTLTVSDPTQLLIQVNLNVTLSSGKKARQLQISLPRIPMAGSSISFSI